MPGPAILTGQAVGETIPAQTPHAVSVSLPTWRSNVGYEEGEEWVMSKMKTGYPRFFIHKEIEKFALAIHEQFGSPSEKVMLFPSQCIALRCSTFINEQILHLNKGAVRIIALISDPEKETQDMKCVCPQIFAVFFPSEHWSTAKAFWQHSGDGVSSRRAEYCHGLFKEGLLVIKISTDDPQSLKKGPRRYRKSITQDSASNGQSDIVESQEDLPEDKAGGLFIEERFGRNLQLKFASNAKLAIKKRIAGSLTADVALEDALKVGKDEERTRQVPGFSEDDIYLYPTGMSSIFNTHRSLMVARGHLKSISYGFPYVDTLKILEKFGPGCLFYGRGSIEDLDALEHKLESGEKFLSLFCEFPGNPLLASPDLTRIRCLADKYGFVVVVDETIGNFLNVNVLPYADVVVSSLTKVFSGDSNVMGGSAILNPNGPYYEQLKRTWSHEFQDNYWVEDAIFMERNSRDFVPRIERININAEAICDVLRLDPRVKQVYYPKHNPTQPFYDICRTTNGGYGGLLSATFFSREDAVAFFDNLATAKGPSLGTNFTLSSPYVILAHYQELDWAESFGVERDLLRFSVGLEDTAALIETFRQALAAIPQR
ncbi:cystathionine gamma-synthase [Tothia fuscella]|uniref:cystathionine gamma-synthase n=1 Tax=Tothia fuscella TaxID=1048955 RepID=A0A9P4NPB8_9PEZI|nr:cystathionine gamma-synthase [Tothia fuscella]